MEEKIKRKHTHLPLILKIILKFWIKALQGNCSTRETRALPFKVTAFKPPTCICLDKLSHGQQQNLPLGGYSSFMFKGNDNEKGKLEHISFLSTVTHTDVLQISKQKVIIR